ncbi:MAG: hypothetical protein V1839_03705 [archaeon]
MNAGLCSLCLEKMENPMEMKAETKPQSMAITLPSKARQQLVKGA